MNFDIDKTEPNILLSIINMKLRDEFSDLNDLSAYYDIDKIKLEDRLGSIGYKYSSTNNQFIKNDLI